MKLEKDEIWSADLIYMLPERGYVLTVIDNYTRYAWGVALKDKKRASVDHAFRVIIYDSKRQPKKVWVDEGKEF